MAPFFDTKPANLRTQYRNMATDPTHYARHVIIRRMRRQFRPRRSRTQIPRPHAPPRLGRLGKLTLCLPHKGHAMVLHGYTAWQPEPLLDVLSHIRGTFHDRIGSLVNPSTNSPHMAQHDANCQHVSGTALHHEFVFLKKESPTTRVARRASSYGLLQNDPCFCAVRMCHCV